MITLSNKTSSTITETIFTLEVAGKVVVYTEFTNDKNKVTDCTLRDANGYEITDDSAPNGNAAELLEQVQNFVDNQEQN